MLFRSVSHLVRVHHARSVKAEQSVCERIVDKVLSISSNIRWVEVKVCKINPPIDVDVQNVSVVIKKER